MWAKIRIHKIGSKSDETDVGQNQKSDEDMKYFGVLATEICQLQKENVSMCVQFEAVNIGQV